LASENNIPIILVNYKTPMITNTSGISFCSSFYSRKNKKMPGLIKKTRQEVLLALQKILTIPS